MAIVGSGSGALFSLGVFLEPIEKATASNAFKPTRGLAVGFVAAGSGLGTFAIAPLTRWLISEFDWRLAMLVLGDLAWLTIIPLALLIREDRSLVSPGRRSGREPDL